MNLHPTRSTFLKIVLGGLLVGIMAFAITSLEPEISTSVLKQENIEIPHSFTAEATGLIDEEEASRKHIEYRLNKYDIKKSLLPTLECRGLNLEKNVTLTIGDMMIPLTAYDHSYKIGYVWLDYNLFGEGLIDNSLTHFKTQKQAEQLLLKQVEMGIELYIDDAEQFMIDIFGDDPLEELEEDIEDDEEVISELSKMEFENEKDFYNYIKTQKIKLPKYQIDNSVNSIREKWDFFEEVYSDEEMLYRLGQEIKIGASEFQKNEDRQEFLELIFLGFKKQIVLNELNQKRTKTCIDDWIFSAAEKLDDPIRFLGFVERVKHFDHLNSKSNLSKAMESEILKITLTSSTKKWWEHSQALISLLQANKTPVTNSTSAYEHMISRIITDHSHKEWPDHYHLINELSNKLTISKSELKSLANLAASHGICIAPLSILDNRTIYDMQEPEYHEQLLQLRDKISGTKDKVLRKSFQKELRDFTHYRSIHYGKIRNNAKSKSMNAIIEDMEVFLDWAFGISEKWQHKEGV